MSGPAVTCCAAPSMPRTESGDLTFAAYSCNNLVTNLLPAGDPLIEVQREAEDSSRLFAETCGSGTMIDIITSQLGLIRTLCGLTQKFGSFDDEQFDEVQFEQHLSSKPDLALAACLYWIRMLQARFFAGDFASAVAASEKAEQLLWTMPAEPVERRITTFMALWPCAAWLDSEAPDQVPTAF